MVAGFNLFWLAIIYLCLKPLIDAQFIASVRRECNPDIVFESESMTSSLGKFTRRISSRMTSIEGRSPAEERLDNEIARKLSLKNLYEMATIIDEQKIQIETQQEAISLLQKQNKDLNDELFYKTKNELQDLRVQVNLLKNK